VIGVRDPATGDVKRFPAVKNEEIKTVSAEQWQIVTEGMAGTLRYGTAAGFAGKNMTYTIAGKTGTAQVFTVARNQSLDNQKTVSDRLRDHSWFIAFAPAEHPRIAVAVIVENGGFGSALASPIARNVMDTYLLDANGQLKVPLPPGTVPLTPGPGYGPIIPGKGAAPAAAAAPKEEAPDTRRRTDLMGIYEPIETGSRSRRTFSAAGRILGALKLDGPLLVGLGLITLYGLVVLYSASAQNWNRVIDGALRAALGGIAMCALAQVKPAFLRRLALPLWVLGVVLLVVVDITGHIGKGAQRWLDLGFIRFQPSEIMKLAVPMTCAWWLHERPLPPNFPSLAALSFIIMVRPRSRSCSPTSAQAGLILIGGMMVVIMAGLQFRVIFGSRPRRRGGHGSRGNTCCTTTRSSASSRCSIRSDKLGAGITSSSRRSRSLGRRFRQGPCERLARVSSSSCPSAPPTSSSRWSARNSVCWSDNPAAALSVSS
jgi:hypothetical protein